jgi:hypothetical protein
MSPETNNEFEKARQSVSNPDRTEDFMWKESKELAVKGPAGSAAFLKILGSQKRRRSCNNVCKNFK